MDASLQENDRNVASTDRTLTNEHSTNSVDEDDFELISNVHDSSVTNSSPIECPEGTRTEGGVFKMSNIHLTPITESSAYDAAISTNAALANDGGLARGESTKLLAQSMVNCLPTTTSSAADPSGARRCASLGVTGLSPQQGQNSFHPSSFSIIDQLSAVESIRADYNAAQDVMQKQIKLLKKTLIEKCEENASLNARVRESEIEKERLQNEMIEKDCKIREMGEKIDNLIAQKLQCDDIIREQSVALTNLSLNDGSDNIPSYITEHQQLVQQGKMQSTRIDELAAKLEDMTKRYADEHAKAIDLEEIAKVLNEENIENNEKFRRAYESYKRKLESLQDKINGYAARDNDVRNANRAN